ncbi:hypothetical protein [Micromonospora trifolii]|nr:hypothetical protein [Micromonospora trifolii]
MKKRILALATAIVLAMVGTVVPTGTSAHAAPARNDTFNDVRPHR